ncbi:hypothetical protein SJAV_12110 [Sulfurisphaera javensis]|uniref:Uncharacterized protein n=1 Tax=Sulfurisphaera javensis TaxID=2049879 RepID=A0AAT9GR38_9CREN
MELDKLVLEIRKKGYNDKEKLMKDLNLLIKEIHNGLKSEIAKAKKANKNVSDIEKELNRILDSLKRLREEKQYQTIRNIKFVMDKRGSEAIELLKKLKQ